ncbi:hypothetical protein SAMN04488692_1098 [Halarsenatibacter silvermanii]|uniref:Uncharacterized protein n=2 Tax=Halarsenatibacter silvermanii TaxID=321763 RepID=A0A1G9MU00_9FIRM|nr:hypothetical protein SAMN04488692_1098 [Halarsenatibacter silvermanii]
MISDYALEANFEQTASNHLCIVEKLGERDIESSRQPFEAGIIYFAGADYVATRSIIIISAERLYIHLQDFPHDMLDPLQILGKPLDSIGLLVGYLAGFAGG